MVKHNSVKILFFNAALLSEKLKYNYTVQQLLLCYK